MMNDRDLHVLAWIARVPRAASVTLRFATQYYDDTDARQWFKDNYVKLVKSIYLKFHAVDMMNILM
jgi:hypothetical protein